jgi:hypothetical protein
MRERCRGIIIILVTTCMYVYVGEHRTDVEQTHDEKLEL